MRTCNKRAKRLVCRGGVFSTVISGADDEPPAFALATAGKDAVDRELKQEQQRKKRRGLNVCKSCKILTG